MQDMNQKTIWFAEGGVPHSLGMRITAAVVILVFTMVTLEPTFAAIRMEHDRHKQEAAVDSAFRQSALGQWRDALLADLDVDGQRQGVQVARSESDDSGRPDMGKHLERLDAQVRELEADFRATRARLEARDVPRHILDRHARAVSEFQEEVDRLRDALVGYSQAEPDVTAAKDLREILDRAIPEPAHQSVDPVERASSGSASWWEASPPDRTRRPSKAFFRIA